MDPTKVVLLIVAVSGFLAVPIAFFAGQIESEGTLRLEMEEELSAMRLEHTEALSAIREEIALLHQGQERIAASMGEDYSSGGIDVSDWEPEPVTQLEAKLEYEPETTLKPAPLQTHVALISPVQIDLLKDGMTYDEAVKVLGCEGVLSMSLDEASGESTQVYRWTWMNGGGAEEQLSITFSGHGITDLRVDAATTADI